MRKIIKNIFILFVPIVLVSFLIFSYNIIKLEFQYAHQFANLYQRPFSWQKYLLLTEIQDFYKKIIESNNQINLPKINIYIKEQSSKKLLSDLPNSIKEWVDAFIIYPEKEMQEVKLRYRGDNTSNWLMSKKNYRIKMKKNQLVGGYRTYDYIPLIAEAFFPYFVFKEMKLLVQEFDLVEVYENGVSKGLYYERPKLDELFLKNNKLMPVSIYKGENHGVSLYFGLNKDIFNNPNLWTKLNSSGLENKNNLANFLKTLMSHQAKPDPSLDDYIDLNYFSKFAAAQAILHNVHNDWFHNMRLILDPWNGRVTQIITDPKMDFINRDGNSHFEFGSNELDNFLGKNTSYIHKKNQWIYYYLTKNDVILSVEKFYDRLRADLAKAEKKEFYFLKFMDGYEHAPSYKLQFEESVLQLNENKKNILKIFESNPKSSWVETDKGFKISVNDYTPLGNLTLSFNDSKSPKWVAVDTNYNNKIDDNEPIFYNKKNLRKINIPLIFYSNRLKKTDQRTHIDQDYRIDYGDTYFKFITDNSVKPVKIESKNLFNGNIFALNDKFSRGSVKTNKFNKIIFIDKPKEKFALNLSGNILVKEDLIINKKTKIDPGTTFLIMPNKNIIFKKQVLANGTKDKPIIFKKYAQNNENKEVKPWGAVAMIGQDTNNSILNHTYFEGGSGGNYNQFIFTGMFSIHDTSDIKIINSSFASNKIYDDTIHVVYSKNIVFKNIKIFKAFNDAIDIDMSNNIYLENLDISDSNQDGLDFMSTDAEIVNVRIKNSNDKGISVGEDSKITIKNSKLSNNIVGIAVKDKSFVKIYNSELIDNTLQIAAYAKKWQYAGGGNIEVYNSKFEAKVNNFSTSINFTNLISDASAVLPAYQILSNNKNKKWLIQNSKINIYNSEFNGPRNIIGKNFSIN